MDVESPESSRDLTPSSSSSQPLANTADSVTTVGSSALGVDDGNVERFLRKMEMEKKMRMLQHRLELASVKTSHGWKDKALDEIEHHLPPSPTIRKRKSQLVLQPSPSLPHPHASSSTLQSPTSPSIARYRSPRPRSLYDALVEPLPPPLHASPTAASPRKRTRPAEQATPEVLAERQQRRASGSMPFLLADPYASPSPVERTREGDRKRRSQSHSQPRPLLRPPAFMDSAEPELDAAKALTSMLGSAIANDTNSDTDDDGRGERKRYSIPIASSRSYPELDTKLRAQSFALQQSPLAPSPSFGTPNASSSISAARGGHLRTPSSHDRHRIPSGSTDTSADDGPAAEDEDKKAAELMIFLAHSPSPMRRTPVTQATAQPSRLVNARVLFGDGGSEPPGKSALAHSSIPSPPAPAHELESAPGYKTWLGPGPERGEEVS